MSRAYSLKESIPVPPLERTMADSSGLKRLAVPWATKWIYENWSGPMPRYAAGVARSLAVLWTRRNAPWLAK